MTTAQQLGQVATITTEAIARHVAVPAVVAIADDPRVRATVRARAWDAGLAAGAGVSVGLSLAIVVWHIARRGLE